MKAKLLHRAGQIRKGKAVEIVTKAEPASSEPKAQSEALELEYTVRDQAGHEESVATRDLRIAP